MPVDTCDSNDSQSKTNKIGITIILMIVGSLLAIISFYLSWFSTIYLPFDFDYLDYSYSNIIGSELLNYASEGKLQYYAPSMSIIMGVAGILLSVLIRVNEKNRKVCSWALVSISAITMLMLLFYLLQGYLSDDYVLSFGHHESYWGPDRYSYPGLGFILSFIGTTMVLADALPIAKNPNNTSLLYSKQSSWEIRTISLLLIFLLMFFLIGAFIGWVFGHLIKELTWYDCGKWFFIAGVIACIYCCLVPVNTILEKMNGKKITKEDEPRLYNIVEGLAQKAKIPTPDIYIIEADYPNAFAIGKSPNKASVAITRPLLSLLDDDEVETVMGHELSHILHRDTIVNGIARTCAKILTLFSIFMGIAALISAAFLGTASSVSSNSKSNISGIGLLIALAILIPIIVVGVVLYISVPISSALLKFGISRRREYSADESSAMITGKPMALASALTKMESECYKSDSTYDNTPAAPLMIVCPFGKEREKLKNRLMSTHPSTASRIEKLKIIDEKLRENHPN